MPTPQRTALITGASRGIGRGIALKLAESKVHVAVHYFQNKTAADDTLAAVRKAGSDGFILRADVRSTDDIPHMFNAVKSRFGHLDIFLANAPPAAAEFSHPPRDIPHPQGDAAVDSQAKGSLGAARRASELMPKGGRI